MKKLILFTVTGISIALINLQAVTAQSWLITGNNNTTALSKLGTTNFIPLGLYTNDQERVHIDEAGRVGIGINAPVNILTVKSTSGNPVNTWLNGLTSPVFVGFADNASSEFVLADASNTSLRRPVIQGRRSRGSLAVPTVVANNDYIASFLASGFDGNTFQNPATIDFFVDGVPGPGNVPARISFVTGSNQGNRTERLKVGSTGNFNFNNNQLTLQQSNGNVGIGTGNLNFSSGSQTIQFANPGASSNAMLTMFTSGSSNNDRMVISHSSAFPSWGLQYRDVGDAFDFLRAGTSVMYVGLGNRSVGIGTASPESRLHVFAGSAGTVAPHVNAQLAVESSGNNYINILAPDASETGILFGKPASNVSGGIIYNNTNALNALQFRTDGNITRMTLNSFGNLVFNSTSTGVVFEDAANASIRGASGSNALRTHGDFTPDTDASHHLGSDAFTWIDVWATDATINTSDARLKENVQNLNYGLKEIMKLRPVSYTWINLEDGEKRIGLIAQEVQKIIPEMVKDHRTVKDEVTGAITKEPTSKLGIQYDLLIPVMTKAIQEQEAVIEAKDQQIADLNLQVNDLKSTIDNLKNLLVTKGLVTKNEINNLGGSASRASLAQSIPNPSAGTTTLSYYLPNDVKKASIIISSVSGAVLKSYPLSQGGNGQITVNARDFAAGVYVYTLVINGNKLDSKKMVLVK